MRMITQSVNGSPPSGSGTQPARPMVIPARSAPVGSGTSSRTNVSSGSPNPCTRHACIRSPVTATTPVDIGRVSLSRCTRGTPTETERAALCSAGQLTRPVDDAGHERDDELPVLFRRVEAGRGSPPSISARSVASTVSVSDCSVSAMSIGNRGVVVVAVRQGERVGQDGCRAPPRGRHERATGRCAGGDDRRRRVPLPMARCRSESTHATTGPDTCAPSRRRPAAGHRCGGARPGRRRDRTSRRRTGAPRRSLPGAARW